jgi:hypothetical protein
MYSGNTSYNAFLFITYSLLFLYHVSDNFREIGNSLSVKLDYQYPNIGHLVTYLENI